jgi:hypothetical protein
MMQMTKRRSWQLIILITALISGGTWAADQFRSMRDRADVADMMQNMRTVCVGRHLLDVPAHANVRLSRQRVQGVEFETIREGMGAFRERVAAREAGIAARNIHAGAIGSGEIVEARDLRISGMIVRTLVYRHAPDGTPSAERRVVDEWLWTEVHAHKDNLSFFLSALSRGESSARLAEALLARLRFRAENEIPPVAGFCIDGAILVEPLPAHNSEQISMHLGLPAHPELALVFATTSSGGSEPGLIERVGGKGVSNWVHKLLRVIDLRSGEHDIDGIGGEEVLESVRELNFTTTYSFEWTADGVDNDPLRPNLLLRLETGGSAWPTSRPVDSSLHRDAVLALWDGISATIRARRPGQELSVPHTLSQLNPSLPEHKLP